MRCTILHTPYDHGIIKETIQVIFTVTDFQTKIFSAKKLCWLKKRRVRRLHWLYKKIVNRGSSSEIFLLKTHIWVFRFRASFCWFLCVCVWLWLLWSRVARLQAKVMVMVMVLSISKEWSHMEVDMYNTTCVETCLRSLPSMSLPFDLLVEVLMALFGKCYIFFL